MAQLYVSDRAFDAVAEMAKKKGTSQVQVVDGILFDDAPVLSALASRLGMNPSAVGNQLAILYAEEFEKEMRSLLKGA